MLLHVMGYVFGGTQAHLQSCISTGRIVAATAAAVPDQAASKINHPFGSLRGDLDEDCYSDGDTSDSEQDREQLPHKLALVSYALALAVTPAAHPVNSSSTAMLGVEARQKLQAELARLVGAAEAAEGGCEWLRGYCDFLQRWHRLGP
jgi:hypothetical protein